MHLLLSLQDKKRKKILFGKLFLNNHLLFLLVQKCHWCH